MALIVMVFTGIIGHMLYFNWLTDVPALNRILLSASAMSLFFLAGSMLTGIIRKDEIRRIPIIGPILAALTPFK